MFYFRNRKNVRQLGILGLKGDSISLLLIVHESNLKKYISIIIYITDEQEV